MKEDHQEQERRRYFRLQPVVEPEPQATLEINGQVIEVKVVNLSPGGLLCYMNGKSAACGANTLIPRIVVKVPDKEPIVYAGKIVRVQPTTESEKKFCAVEFVEFNEKLLRKGSKPLRPFTDSDRDAVFLHRLESFQNFLTAGSLEEELTLRKMIYDGFQAESKRLPLEERWFFYEVIDEMKRRQPNYPEGLKREFLRLCRGEDRSEFVPMRKSGHGWKFLLRKILPH